MRIFIEPLEPLFFRSGKPFAAGENNYAETIFPPTPETLQGALRAMLAVQWGKGHNMQDLSEIFKRKEIQNLIGGYISYGRLRITGSTLGRWMKDKDGNIVKDDDGNAVVERLFPPPANILRVSTKKIAATEKDEEKQFLTLLYPGTRTDGITNIPTDMQPLFPDLQGSKLAEKAEELSEWLTPAGLEQFLQGNVPDENSLVKTKDIFERESRLGIGIDSSKGTTREGYLYQTQVVRMKEGCGFVIDLKFGDAKNGATQQEDGISPEEKLVDEDAELHFLKDGWMTMGGEQRTAHFEVVKSQADVKQKDDSSNKTGNFVYFASPAYFAGGWKPKNSSLLPEKLIAASINRYQPIGGWALEAGNAGGKAKTTRRCIPAGSVLYFDRDITVNRPLTEYGWQIGYGITYTGHIETK